MYKVLFFILGLLGCCISVAASATPPPNKQESVICEITGEVFLFSNVKIDTIQKSNQHNYDNPLISSSEQNDIRIDVESAVYNDKTRFGCEEKEGCISVEYTRQWCESLAGKVMEIFPLCQKKQLELGQKIRAKFQRGYVYGNGFCLDVE